MKSWLIHTTTIINTLGDCMCSCHPYQQCCGPITKSDLTPTGTMESMHATYIVSSNALTYANIATVYLL